MKKYFILIYALIAFNVCFSQTTINSGNVSGIWEKSKSPYKIFGEITIIDGQTLTIEKGVTVEFQGHYRLNVQGRILALGDNIDTIIFTSKDTNTKWGGVRFDQTPITNDSSKLSFCIVENCNTPPNLPGNWYGPDECGGGIFIRTSKLMINNSVIRNNKAYKGGGIYCLEDNPIIKNTKIINNYAAIHGGVSINSGSPKFIGCIISNNTAIECGGLYYGCHTETDTALFLNNTICNNVSKDSLYPAIITFGWPKFINTIFYYNTPSLIQIGNNPKPQFLNCDIEGGFLSILDNNPTLKGRFDGVYKNNFENPPVFVDSKKGDYQLAASPCINSGLSSYVYGDYNSDINGNPRIFNDSKACVDIGAYEFQGPTPNRTPYIRGMTDQYFLLSQKSKLPVYYFEADSTTTFGYKVKTNSEHVNASILNTNDSLILVEVVPEKDWTGECYLYLNIDDNSNNNNSTSLDSIKIHISDRFKGNINSDFVFKDTVKVIGDITINECGSLVIQPGSYIEFQDYYKIRVFGKLNILGTSQNQVILNALDTAVLYISTIRFEKGWAGIEFVETYRTDTMFIENCIIRNTGLDKSRRNSNGTISIRESKNINFNNCSFQSNFHRYWENQNSGIYVENSSNIKVQNCAFSEGYSVECFGTYVNSFGSDIVIDRCKFFNTSFNGGDYNWHGIYCENSNLRITNSDFYNNNFGRYLVSSHSGKLLVENCTLKDNNSSGIEINTNGSIIRNNVIINNVIAIRCDVASAKIVNNLVGYNKVMCGCQGVIELAVAGESVLANNTIVNNYVNSYEGTPVHVFWSNPKIVNNIFWNNTNSFTNIDGVSSTYSYENGELLPIIKNNLIKGANSYNLDLIPLFRFNDSLDFQLLSNSPGIDLGLSDTSGLFLPDYDLSGNKRFDNRYHMLDLGAYEYQSSNGIKIPMVGEFDCYPNPTKSSLYFSEELNASSYSIFNLNGKVVQSGTITNNTINVNRLNKSTYILRINSQNSYQRTTFIKN